MVNSLRLERNFMRLFDFAVNVYHTADNFAAAQHFDQLAGTVDGCTGIIRIQTLFEFALGIGTHTELLAGETDIGAVKAGCFK